MRIVLLSCCAALIVIPAAAQPQPFAIAIGQTDLLAAAQPDVGYQLDGKPPVALGHGWTGFDPASGVYFVSEDTPERLSQVFMHCPWVAGPGVAFADYALKLPDAPRIRLAFQIGLRPTATKTDGVTYRVKVDGKPLFEQHVLFREFRPFAVDLSPFAGKEITLRLEVDPGPARNTSDDWSLWHDVEVLAGTDEQVAAARAKAAAELARRRAADIERGAKLAETSLLPLASRNADSARPSVLAPTKTTLVRDGAAYIFRCQGADQTIEYRLDPAVGLLDGLTVRVNGKLLQPSPFRGGPIVHLDGRDFGPTSAGGNGLRLFPLPPREGGREVGTSLSLQYRYTNPDTGSVATLSAVLSAQGKSLCLDLSGDPDRFSGFAAQVATGQPVTSTFAIGPIRWLPQGLYISSIADLMRSASSGFGSGDHTDYWPLTNGKRNALRETFYLTVTSRYEEAFSNPAHKPSPYLADLSHRVVLDGWGGSFAENEKWLRDIAPYGVNSFLMIKHVWQRDGYDHTYPDTMPANAAMGGDEALRSLSLTAQRLGHRFNVHENYYDYYPNAESFKEADRCLDPQGKPIPGWDNGQVRAVILKPSKLMDYARRFTSEIKRYYDCNSAYHDIMPTWHVDYDALAPGAGSIAYTHEQTRALCDFDRSLFGGPVVFEAADPFMAGVYDGGCNHGVDTYRTPIAVVAELLKVHPKMANHGFGYYERWLPWGYGPGWSTYVMTDRELDKYRAYTIAFGRVGFIGQQLMQNPHGVVREYHLMQAFGRAYTGRLVTHIRYEMDGHWVDAGTAARYGELSRLNIEYEGGQQVYSNLSDKPWRIAGRVLPPNGSFTTGPRGEAGTTLRDGQIADYARYGGVTFADARSHTWQPAATPDPITPSVAELKPLGGKQFELTVNWKVGRKPERDYTIFLHFISGSTIAFQADHAPPRPTTTWQIGETITDGPIRLSVKDDATVSSYDIVVGLYDNQGRAPLVRGADGMKIGRLVVDRAGAEATSVRFEPASADQAPGSDPAAYLEGANVTGKIIDFGDIATNGAVVARGGEPGEVGVPPATGPGGAGVPPATGPGGVGVPPATEPFDLTPVPLGARFAIGLAGPIRTVAAFDTAGKPLPAPALSRRGGKVWFETAREVARYVVTP